MAWDIEYTNEFAAWWETLTLDEQDSVSRAVEVLEEQGPATGRPLVDTIHGSRHSHMKELRPPGTFIRVLFAFDPRRVAILLLGGNKAGRWREWYTKVVPVADQLYDIYLEELRREGLI